VKVQTIHHRTVLYAVNQIAAAPATTKAPIHRSMGSAWPVKQTKLTGTTTNKPTAMKKYRCQPLASASKENAAPVLSTCTRFSQLVNSMPVHSGIVAANQALLP